MKSLLLDPADWQRVSPYLDDALDLSLEERERWLTHLGEAEPALAASVRKLLTEYDELTQCGFLDGSPLPALSTQMSGKRVGAYTFEHLLGRGGMGEVWLASRHDGRFEGHCAIKLLDDALAKPGVASRFRREAHLLARLVHPHIARLLDAGTTDEGRPYLALEYVDGERIDHYCQSNALSVRARVTLFLDVVEAAAHAHANLIIHRDLKPSNVLITRAGEVKLLDFGIAKPLDGPSQEIDSTATRVEEIALTPDYAAPEQIIGDAPSTATDVYQLGMLLYVLLTGRHPRPGTTRRSDLAKAALRDDLPRASEIVADPLRRALRGDLDAILAMALRNAPAERYPTAAALGEDLRRYLNGEPVSARRGGALYHARKFYRRHQFAVLGTAAAAVSLFVIAMLALEQAHEAARQRDQARVEAKRADAQARFLSLSMTQIDASGKPVTPELILENAEKLLEAHYAQDPAFVVDTLIELSGHYNNLGNREREYAALVKAEGIARKSGDLLALARVQCARVDTDIAVGHADQAAAHLAEGRAALARASNRTLGDEVDCLHAQASLSDENGQPLEAIRLLESAVARLEAREPDHDSRYTSLVSHLAGLYGRVGNTQKAFESVHKHRLAEEHTYGTDTQGLLAAMHNEACALRDVGEIQAALAAEAAVIERNRSNEDQAAFTAVYGALLVQLDRPAEALPWLERAVASALKVNDLFFEANARVWHAAAFQALHRDAEAEAELEAGDRVAAKGPRAMTYEATLAAIVRARLLASQGKLEDAHARIEPVLVNIRDPAKGLTKLSSLAWLTASRVEAARGQLADAERYAREALHYNESRARDPARSAHVGEAALVLAQIRLKLNDPDGAHELARRAASALESGAGANHSLTRAALALAQADASR